MCPGPLGFQLQPRLRRDGCQCPCGPSGGTAQAAACRTGAAASFLVFYLWDWWPGGSKLGRAGGCGCCLCSPSPATHHPLFLPLLRPQVQQCPDEVGPCPDVPAVHSWRAQAATDFGFCWKGWAVTPGCCMGVEINPSHRSALFAFCTGLHTPGFEFWFQALSIKQWFSLRRIYLLITWKIPSKSEALCKGI